MDSQRSCRPRIHRRDLAVVRVFAYPARRPTTSDENGRPGSASAERAGRRLAGHRRLHRHRNGRCRTHCGPCVELEYPAEPAAHREPGNCGRCADDGSSRILDHRDHPRRRRRGYRFCDPQCDRPGSDSDADNECQRNCSRRSVRRRGSTRRRRLHANRSAVDHYRHL